MTSASSSTTVVAETLVEILRERAARQRSQRIYTFLHGEEEKSLTYAEIDQLARSTAAVLLLHCSPGDRVLLIYPPGLEYIVALFACMYAGIIAVPSYAPRPNRPLTRLEAIISNSEPKVVLTTRALLDSPKSIFHQQVGPLANLLVLSTDDLTLDLSAEAQPISITAKTPVILQYTSGSTAFPKGVTLTHGNIVHNTGAIERNFPLDT